MSICRYTEQVNRGTGAGSGGGWGWHLDDGAVEELLDGSGHRIPGLTIARTLILLTEAAEVADQRRRPFLDGTRDRLLTQAQGIPDDRDAQGNHDYGKHQPKKAGRDGAPACTVIL